MALMLLQRGGLVHLREARASRTEGRNEQLG